MGDASPETANQRMAGTYRPTKEEKVIRKTQRLVATTAICSLMLWPFSAIAETFDGTSGHDLQVVDGYASVNVHICNYSSDGGYIVYSPTQGGTGNRTHEYVGGHSCNNVLGILWMQANISGETANGNRPWRGCYELYPTGYSQFQCRQQ